MVVLASSREEAVSIFVNALAAAAEDLHGPPHSPPEDLTLPAGVHVGTCTDDTAEPAPLLRGRLKAWADQGARPAPTPPAQGAAAAPSRQLDVPQPAAASPTLQQRPEQEQQRLALLASRVGPHPAEISHFRSGKGAHSRAVLDRFGVNPYLLLCPALHEVVLAHDMLQSAAAWAAQLRQSMSEEETAAVAAKCTPAAAQAAGAAAAEQLQAMQLPPHRLARVRELFPDGEQLFFCEGEGCGPESPADCTATVACGEKGAPAKHTTQCSAARAASRRSQPPPHPCPPRPPPATQA